MIATGQAGAMNEPVTKCLSSSLTFCTEQLAAIPEFKSLGPLFKSSEPVQLTEAETEYFVRCIKHVFTNHIVFQVREFTRFCQGAIGVGPQLGVA